MWDPVAEHAVSAGLDESARRLAPASVVAVCRGGRVLAVAAHGEVGPRAPTTRETVFRIASMSKSFLSAAVLVLRDRGLIDLYAPITRYVPYARARYRGADVEMTGDLLLSNRAGLGEDNAWADRNLGASRERIAALFAGGVSLSASPGTAYQYSNLGQALLGRAVENVTGRAVEDVVHEVLLAPLGLDRTAYVADGYDGAALAGGYRTFDGGATFAAEPFVGSGALACIGSMFSTVDDIAAWMDFLGSAFTSRPTRPEVLSVQSRLGMQQPHTPIPVAVDAPDGRILTGAGYGYGLVIEDDRRFGRIVQHSGGLPGFSSHMRWHAATGVGVVAFGNSDEFGAKRVATTALREVLEGVDAPAAVVRPWRATIEAAGAIDAALLRGERAAQLPLLADNLLRDVPAEVRDAGLARDREQIGGVRSAQSDFAKRIVTAANEDELRWRIEGERGDLIVEIRMIALPEPRVQSLTVSAIERGHHVRKGQSSGVEEHYRIDLSDAVEDPSGRSEPRVRHKSTPSKNRF
ncbi:beta-lactamase family protein [Microbacterium sp. ISL-108]|nr:beta-lactamase family protein [Microbacterium sp. ISL-108]RKN69675.1 class A beta-lactamase-related serine hydrolase [Microbacterium sp. CGR2]